MDLLNPQIFTLMETYSNTQPGYIMDLLGGLVDRIGLVCMRTNIVLGGCGEGSCLIMYLSRNECIFLNLLRARDSTLLNHQVNGFSRQLVGLSMQLRDFHLRSPLKI